MAYIINVEANKNTQVRFTGLTSPTPNKPQLINNPSSNLRINFYDNQFNLVQSLDNHQFLYNPTEGYLGFNVYTPSMGTVDYPEDIVEVVICYEDDNEIEWMRWLLTPKDTRNQEQQIINI